MKKYHYIILLIIIIFGFMNVQVAINDGISINIKPSKQYQLVKDRLQNNIAESSQKAFTLMIESVNKFLTND